MTDDDMPRVTVLHELGVAREVNPDELREAIRRVVRSMLREIGHYAGHDGSRYACSPGLPDLIDGFLARERRRRSTRSPEQQRSG